MQTCTSSFPISIAHSKAPAFSHTPKMSVRPTHQDSDTRGAERQPTPPLLPTRNASQRRVKQHPRNSADVLKISSRSAPRRTSNTTRTQIHKGHQKNANSSTQGHQKTLQPLLANTNKQGQTNKTPNYPRERCFPGGRTSAGSSYNPPNPRARLPSCQMHRVEELTAINKRRKRGKQTKKISDNARE